jgi:hypothetical protein
MGQQDHIEAERQANHTTSATITVAQLHFVDQTRRTGASGCSAKTAALGASCLLKLGAGAGPAASLIVASDVVLEAADREPTEGGGAFSFSFSARASSSLPLSTHILSCSAGQYRQSATVKGSGATPQHCPACCWLWNILPDICKHLSTNVCACPSLSMPVSCRK